MNKDWTTLMLGGYLEEKVLHGGGTTFIRTLPETEELPEITVGLGIISQQGALTSAVLAPQSYRGRMKIMMVNTLINEVAEKYFVLADEFPDSWQEVLLLDFGYVHKNPNKFPVADDYSLLNSIPKEDRLSLYRRFGLHKIATLVAYGHTDNIESVLSDLDTLNSSLPKPANYGKIMSLLAAGVPSEDFHLAVDLPDDMLSEFYN